MILTIEAILVFLMVGNSLFLVLILKYSKTDKAEVLKENNRKLFFSQIKRLKIQPTV